MVASRVALPSDQRRSIAVTKTAASPRAAGMAGTPAFRRVRGADRSLYWRSRRDLLLDLDRGRGSYEAARAPNPAQRKPGADGGAIIAAISSPWRAHQADAQNGAFDHHGHEPSGCSHTSISIADQSTAV
jgi:hypothetical protein